MGLLETKRLIQLRRHPSLGRWAHRALRWFSSLEIPSSVEIGDDLVVHHNAMGTVIHPWTTIGARVHLFQGVTIGRADVTTPRQRSPFVGVVVEDDVWICSNATVLGGPGTTTLGRGTVVAAGAVLLESTGEWEVWAGVPARCVGKREPVPEGRHYPDA